MARRRVLPAALPAGDDGEQVAALSTDPDDSLWRDEDRLRVVFDDLVDRATVTRLRMGGRVDNHLRGRWALRNGFETETEDGRKLVDWHAFRAFIEGDA